MQRHLLVLIGLLDVITTELRGLNHRLGVEIVQISLKVHRRVTFIFGKNYDFVVFGIVNG